MSLRSWAAIALLALTGCGALERLSSPEQPPAELLPLQSARAVETVWVAQAGQGVLGRHVRLQPVLAADRLYVADVRGRISAFQSSDGGVLWRVETGLELSGGLGFGAGLVLFGTREGEVVALSAETGEQVWRVGVSSEVLAAPQVGDGVVVVQTNDGKVTGLAREDGHRIWTHERRVPVLSLRGTAAPLVQGGRAFVGFDNGTLVALGLQNGRALWEVTVAVPKGRSELQRMVDVDATPYLLDNVLYVVAYQGRLVAVDATRGQILWSRETSSYTGLVANAPGLFYTDAEDHVWALDRSSGGALWKQDKLHGRRLTAPVIQDGLIVVGDYEGYLHWLSPDDGRVVARSRIKEPAGWAFEAEEGARGGLGGRYVEDQSVIGTPIVDGGVLYAVASNGTVNAFRLPASP